MVKKHLGGNITNMVLAYPANNIHAVRNPSLAYKGGNSGIYPAKGPAPDGFHFLNPQVHQRGGKKKRGSKRKYKGGCGCSIMNGGKTKRKRMRGGNSGIPYPNGLVGSPWTANAQTWPGVNGISGDSNYLAYNKYPTDVQTSIIDSNSIPPKPMVAGSRKNKRKKGGSATLTNLMGQDFVNFGRQIQYGLGSAYNALSGYAPPVNPLPFKDQLPPIQK